MNLKSMTLLLSCIATVIATMPVNAQQPIRHEMIQGDMPPGMAARFYQMSDPSLVGHTQPVQLVAPKNTIIEIGDANGLFAQAQVEKMSVGMAIGYVYRFKLSNLPQPDAAGKTLYPSIEVIGRISPPSGLAVDFPVQVVVTRDDIDLALSGRMVTRVIYLEDSRGTLPHLHTENNQPSVDVRRGQDPLRAAQQMGRPMAILRMGSRVPMENEIAEWFAFGIAAPQVLPNPRPANLAGLNERELQIVNSMKQTDENAKAVVEVESKQASQISQADFKEADSQVAALRQTSVNELVDGPVGWEKFANNGIASASEAAQPLATVTQVALTVPKAGKPNWLQVKANVEPEPQPVKRPAIKDMTPIRPVTPAKEINTVKPPAPSMAGLDFEAVDSGSQAMEPVAKGLLQPLAQDSFQPLAQESLQPLAMPTFRRPNEL